MTHWTHSALATICRHYPFYSGASRVANSRFLGRLANSSEVAWCDGPGGQMLVPLDDFVGRCIFFTGDYDPKVTWICRQLVRAGDTVFDLGANLGVVSLVLAKLVGPHGAVHSFEPNPRMRTLLETAARRNGFENIHLHPVALGSETCNLELCVPRANNGQGSLIYHRDDPDCDVVHCQVRRFSDVVRDQRIKQIRFIKIDVEGFENEVLLGAEEAIASTRPDAILFETNEKLDLPFRERPPIVTLMEHGYRFFGISRSLLSARLERFNIDSQGEPPGHDILAVPVEKYDSMAVLLRA